MTRRGHFTRSLLLVSLGASAIVTNPGPARGGNVPSCSYDAATKLVTATASATDEQVTMFLENGEIKASGTDCGDATRFNTDRVVVNDVESHALQGFITLFGGRFRPGFTNEPGSSDEIEFVFNLGDGSPQWFDVHGTDGVEVFRLGSFEAPGVRKRRLNLNANESTGIDHDVVVNGQITDFIMEGFGGNDVLDARGGAGTGQPYSELARLSGYDNADRLYGGEGGDVLDGDSGRDLVVGSPGGDQLTGGGGNDVLKAGRGADYLAGEKGDDEHIGGPGDDECFDAQGINSFDGCESINEM